MNPFAQEPSEASIEKDLFRNAMESKWTQVIAIYKQDQKAHRAKITRSGDTALHIAIADGQESIVEELVSIVAAATPDALEIPNELGDTPLHLAAYQGKAWMCHCIAKQGSKLMGIRNKDNETPFCIAARHGRNEAFLCLHFLCKKDEGYAYCRGRDGETILHSAISGEYFGMAFQIIHLYDKLVNSVNEQGFSPLHVLASKPSAFRSGSQIRGLDKLVYHCIFVDQLKPNNSSTQEGDFQNDDKTAKYPKNYQTCVGMFVLLKNIIRVLIGHSRQQQDAENPKGQQLDHRQGGVRQLCFGFCENRNDQQADAERQQSGDEKGVRSTRYRAQGHEFLPENYYTCFRFLQFIAKLMLVILGVGSRKLIKMREKKQKHIWSVQILEKLLEQASLYQYEDNGRSPGKESDKSLTGPEPPAVPDDHSEPPQSDKVAKESTALEMEKKETPILIAAKNGVEEMVAMILERFSVAIHDTNNEKKNIVLLAVENRQPHVYKFLLDQKRMKENIFRKTDKDGNSALHLAAKLGDYRPWLIPGAALQMQWEIKWYEFVKNSMPLHFFPRYNSKFRTARDIFSETHRELAKEGGEWLTNTSQSCSVVAALIATVAFATSATVPGGVKQDSGTPTLENEPAFSIFAISSLVALCFSVTSVVMFLAILTSRYQEKDFGTDLPRKLLVGLTSLFVSIGSMLLSFCAGHFFVLKEKLQYAAFPMYAITCLPVTFFAFAQFPLYFDLVKATIKKVPQRSSK